MCEKELIVYMSENVCETVDSRKEKHFQIASMSARIKKEMNVVFSNPSKVTSFWG